MTQGPDMEHTPRKSVKHLAQKTGVSKSSARRNVLPVFLTKQLIAKKYLRVKRTAFSTPPVICELLIISF
jgi:hypothetical protein